MWFPKYECEDLSDSSSKSLNPSICVYEMGPSTPQTPRSHIEDLDIILADLKALGRLPITGSICETDITECSLEP